MSRRFTLATLERKARFARNDARKDAATRTSLARFADAPTSFAILEARNSDRATAERNYITNARRYNSPRPQ